MSLSEGYIIIQRILLLIKLHDDKMSLFRRKKAKNNFLPIST